MRRIGQSVASVCPGARAVAVTALCALQSSRSIGCSLPLSVWTRLIQAMTPFTACAPVLRITVWKARLSPIWGEAGLRGSGVRSTASVCAEAAVARVTRQAAANRTSFIGRLLLRDAAKAGASEPEREREPEIGDENV